jgi:hypothetical protein
MPDTERQVLKSVLRSQLTDRGETFHAAHQHGYLQMRVMRQFRRLRGTSTAILGIDPPAKL